MGGKGSFKLLNNMVLKMAKTEKEIMYRFPLQYGLVIGTAYSIGFIMGIYEGIIKRFK